MFLKSMLGFFNWTSLDQCASVCKQVSLVFFVSVFMASPCLSSVLTHANLTMYQTGIADVLPQRPSALPNINTLQIRSPHNFSGEKNCSLVSCRIKLYVWDACLQRNWNSRVPWLWRLCLPSLGAITRSLISQSTWYPLFSNLTQRDHYLTDVCFDLIQTLFAQWLTQLSMFNSAWASNTATSQLKQRCLCLYDLRAINPGLAMIKTGISPHYR